MTNLTWGGRVVERARAYMRKTTTWPTPCHQCGKPVHPDPPRGWVVEHIKSRGAHPELTHVRTNWAVSHRSCSDATGQQGVIEKAKAEARRHSFSPEPKASESPPLPKHTHEDPTLVPGIPVRLRPGLSWAELCQDPPTWLSPFLEVPPEGSPPRLVSAVHPEAVGSYGQVAIDWMEANLMERGRPLRLRWWQKLAFVLQLQHRADGSLCWRVILESGPRRIGKSVRLRASSLWRLRNGPALFEPEQLIVHTGRDLAIVREVLRKAWPWAEAQPDWATKRGMTEPEVSYDGVNRWVARSKDSTSGYDCCLAHADECWDIQPASIDDDLEPSMLERESPQLVLTSTAHRKATSLMRGRISDVLASDDGETMILLWGAPAGADITDPEVWRSSSPYWTESRRSLMASKLEKALRGEQDPELDDIDPVRGFMSQYLNVWHLSEVRTVGDPVISPEAWAVLEVARPDGPPDSVAVEAWFGAGVAVVEAWKPAGGPVVVSVSDHPSLTVAAAHVAACGLRRPVLVGASLADHPAWRTHSVRVKPMTGATTVAVGDLMRDLGEHRFVHDGSQLLTDQVVGLRTSASASGPRVRSTGRLDAVKALVWSVDEAATMRRGMVIPSRFKTA